MNDDNWDLINGQDAHDIEVLNHTNQINVIEALLKFSFHHGGNGQDGCPLTPTCLVLRELHRSATLFLLNTPGQYRDTPVHIVRSADGVVVYEPPAAADVPAHMEAFEGELKAMWVSEDAISVASFALWRINWVHPFKNGNGRTARAFAYACLCLKYGFLLPGTPTVIDMIMNDRGDYQAALREADETYQRDGKANLIAMRTYLERLVLAQFSKISAHEPAVVA